MTTQANVVDDTLMVSLLVHEKGIGNQSGAGRKKQVWTMVQKGLAVNKLERCRKNSAEVQ
jgi:hypothetical protein